jgi:hypothetical protein
MTTVRYAYRFVLLVHVAGTSLRNSASFKDLSSVESLTGAAPGVRLGHYLPPQFRKLSSLSDWGRQQHRLQIIFDLLKEYPACIPIKIPQQG